MSTDSLEKQADLNALFKNAWEEGCSRFVIHVCLAHAGALLLLGRRAAETDEEVFDLPHFSIEPSESLDLVLPHVITGLTGIENARVGACIYTNDSPSSRGTVVRHWGIIAETDEGLLPTLDSHYNSAVWATEATVSYYNLSEEALAIAMRYWAEIGHPEPVLAPD